MGPADLAKLLDGLPRVADPRVLVGYDGHDDAGVFLVRDDLVMVQSIDVFGPVVDDPYAYGQIAAANSLSDLYAMGVSPQTAVAFAAFPEPDVVPPEVLAEILRGGADKAIEAGCAIIGGHTIRDREPKYGLCVTGFCHPDDVITNAGGRVGDHLILTKPLGSGILSARLKKGLLEPSRVADVTRVMATLNRAASEAAQEVGVNAMTDVTGFGLLGHLRELCIASGLAAQLGFRSLPVMDGVVDSLRAGQVPGGSRRNLRFVEGVCSFGKGVGEESRLLMADAQTSGGLLVAVASEKVEQLQNAMRSRGVETCVDIGRLVEQRDGVVIRVDDVP